MKCLIPGSNLRVFGKTVHALSKFGDDLYIEPLEKGLALKTVNSSRSAFAFVLFAPNFFIKYQNRSPGDTSTSRTEGEEPFRCRITAKSCLRIFKSPSALEKNVDRCQISLNSEECRLVFLLNCRHGITKTFNLTYQETETLQAVFAKDLSPNRITADARALSVVSSSFKPSQEEVTMTINPSELSFKNYVEDEPDPGRVTHSQLKLPPEEFNEYSIGVDTEVTFCLKEFKAILSLSDTVRLPLSMRFETTGKPIVFSFESEGSLEGTFVLATLAEVPSSQSSQPSQAVSQRNTSDSSSRGKKSNKTAASVSDKRQKPRHNGVEHSKDGLNREAAFPNDLGWQEPAAEHAASNHDQPSTSTAAASPVFPVNSFVERLHHPPQVDTPTGDAARTLDNIGGSGDGKRASDANSTFLANFMGSDDQQPVSEHRLRTSPAREEDDLDSEDDFDFVPSTPPSKKFKSMFFGSTQTQHSQAATTDAGQPGLSASRVLAEDSDEDE